MLKIDYFFYQIKIFTLKLIERLFEVKKYPRLDKSTRIKSVILISDRILPRHCLWIDTKSIPIPSNEVMLKLFDFWWHSASDPNRTAVLSSQTPYSSDRFDFWSKWNSIVTWRDNDDRCTGTKTTRVLFTGTGTCWRTGTKSRSSAKRTDAASRTATPGRCAGTRRTITTISRRPIRVRRPRRRPRRPVPVAYNTRRRPCRRRRPPRARRPPRPRLPARRLRCSNSSSSSNMTRRPASCKSCSARNRSRPPSPHSPQR